MMNPKSQMVSMSPTAVYEQKVEFDIPKGYTKKDKR